MYIQGWEPNPAATEAFVARLPRVYGDQVEELIAQDNDADALNYRALASCLAKEPSLAHWLDERDGVKCVVSRQQGNIGSCVGAAEARLLDVLAAFEIVAGDREEFPACFSHEGLYGLGREKGNMLRPGDGLYGSAIAEAVSQWGTLHELVYNNIDLRKYSPTRCREYGRVGVPRSLKDIAGEHKVGHVTRVTRAEQGWALLGSGYPINMCSSLGWVGNRDSEGIIRRRGSWMHSMAVTSRRTTKNGARVVLVHQSWPLSWAKGPYWEDMPWGSFWIHLADFDAALKQGDSFAHSSYDGFKKRSLPDLGFTFTSPRKDK